MAVAQGPFLAAVLLLVSSWLHCSSPLPACPESCTCPSTPLLNCSSTGLSFVPQQIQDSVTDLDLSHNLLDSVAFDRPHRSLRNVWLGNNSITHLSLCVERSIRGRHAHRLRPQSRRGCVSWAPTLQLLSVERNQLEQLPQGLEGSKSLQVLQLSFNKISTLQPGDLSHLRQLKELHLQHNLITSLHPQMFQDLAQLQVLDLSFNMLTSLHPLTYFSLRNIGADVQLGGNSWQCDCSMRSLRRRMAYDSSRGLQAWSVVCATPSIISGRDLLQVEEHDLNCFSAEDGPELHRDVTVYSGSEILLSCSTQDPTWWTPSGQASVSQPQAGLLISDVTERDAGLYVCVCEEHEVVSVFNLQISKIGGARRKTRSLPRTSQRIIPQDTTDRIGQNRNPRATQSDLALAVCLSVFITFLIAFILGVLARPCIDVLWGRITKKKRTSATDSVSSVEQRQYDNEAYCDGEEPEQIGAHRERRVTFSTVDYREDRNVQYYDTVAGDNQDAINNEAVIECDTRNTHTARDSGSENSVRLSITEDNQRDGTVLSGGHKHSIEFEHIPDPVEQETRRSLSSCSDSSQSDKVFNEDQMTKKATTKSHQLAEDSIQQKADSSTGIRVEVSQISVEGTSELPGFSSEPFADWSPHTNNTNHTDPELWQENEEQFEFSDSVHSSSVRSSSIRGSFNDSKLILVPASVKQRTDDSSSSSSYVSDDEPTQYTVNSDQEEDEEDKERIHNNAVVTNATLKQDLSFEQQIHSVDSIRPTVRFNQEDYRYNKQRPVVRPEDSFSFHSSDSDVDDYTVKKGHVPSLAVTSHSKSLDTGAPSPSAAYPSSSSSESEAEVKDLKVERSTGRLNEGIKINKAETLSTDRDRICIPQIKRRVDIKAPLPASDSSSSDESTDETTKHTKKQEQGEVNMAGQSVTHDAMKPQSPALDPAPATTIKRRAPLPPIDSSGDESAKKTMEQKQGETQMVRLPIKVSQTASHDSDIRWPALDLEATTRIKRRLDIKALSPLPESCSSSDSEDETTNHIKKQEQEQMNMARPPGKVPDTARYNPQTQWPLLDLQHTKHIKRRLDVKAPHPNSDSSSSSDSEDETTHHTEMPGKVEIARLPLQESQTGSHDPSTMFPSIDLEHIPHIMRRLDIKAPTPTPSSSSDSEDETTHHTQRPGNVEITGLPFQESQTKSHNPETRRPALGLDQTMHIKRRLDIKAPSPPPTSSSSSDSEDETINHISKQEQGQINMARLPSKVPDTALYNPQTQWPLLDLQHTKHIKRRLDVKAPSPDSDSSSSSDSDNETTHHIQRPGKVGITGLPFKESQTGSHDPDTRWPALDLEHIPRIKRRLDVKAPSPDSDSSSSSDSEDETTHHTEMPGKVEIARLPLQESQTGSHDPSTMFPSIDLEHIPHIMRRLDIKAPTPTPSSSSDSEDETTHHTQRPGNVEITGLPFQESQTKSHNPETRRPALGLDQTMHIKRRLDIKAPSPPPTSSSSSDSEDETINHISKQEQGQINMARLPSKVPDTALYNPQTQWPLLDLQHTKHIKRRLDVKAPSPDSDSSSSSDSDNETTHHIQRPGKVGITGLPFKESQTGSHDPDTRWPALDLEHIPRIKRRLDVKAPSPDSDSSSSSDSEDETTHHTEMPGKVEIAGLPLQESQTGSHDPGTMFPSIDLEHIPHIKRRLDIKAPTPPPPDSSSSSDSEDETTHHTQRPGKVAITGLPFKESRTESHDPDTRWPALDLEQTMHIKRHLDIKAPSPPPTSSSSSDSEDETVNHISKQEQEQMNIARLPSKVPDTALYNPQTQWPLLDLQHTKHIKRRLDVKAPSPDSDSNSSSDSEDETSGDNKKQRSAEVDIAEPLFEKSQTGSHDPGKMFPSIDLEHIPHIKRRLDIKVPSPPQPDSSSSSDSEDETTHHTQRPGKVAITGLPFKESQTESHDPDTRWPALDLEQTMHIKRRLDIKAPSPPPTSSSSSDSEDETINHIRKQEQGQMNMARLPSKEPETAHYNPQTQWPLLDLQHTKHIKRRLDVKAPSPDSDSNSSSDSEDETSGDNKKQRPAEVDIAEKFEKSQTGSHDPGKMFPSIDLEHIPHIKRRLDIKAPSPPLDPPSNCERVEKHEQRKVHISRHPSQESQAESHDPDTPWPVVDLEHTMRVKRRLDIKAPPLSSDSSLSSDSEDETTHQVKKGEQGETHMARPPITVSQTLSSDPQTQWPLLDLEHTKHVKRRLDVKAPSPDTDSSSSSDSEDETTHHTERQREVDFAELPLQKSQTINQDPETQWPALDLEHNLGIKRRLDIKVPSPVSDSSSSSDSEDETTHSAKTKTPGVVGVVGPPFQESQTVSRDPETQWPTVDLGNITRIKRRLDIKAPSPPPDSFLSGGSTNPTVTGKRQGAIKISPGHSSSSSDEQEKSIENLRYPPPTVKPDSRWPTLSLNSDLHVKRRLDIRAHSPPSESSSSSDESESRTTNPPKTGVGITSHRPEGKMPDLKVNAPPVKRRLNIKAPSAQPDPVLSSVSPSSQQPESNSSRGNIEDEHRNQAKPGLRVSASLKTMEKEFITAPETPLLNISHRPKADHNIILEKYTVVTDDVGVKTSDNISRPPEINPELQSRWATMDLGISRFRKRLEITSQTREPPNLPSSPPPDSPSSSSDSGTGSKSSKTRQKREGVGIQGIIHTESSVTTKNNMQWKAGTELRSQTSVESHSVHPHLSLTNIPHVKRTLDIRAPLQRESSTSNSSEDETIAHSVPDLSLGVPRVKKRLDIKAPSPEPSNSSSSESENGVRQNMSNMSGMIDNDQLITYKRLIMKPSSPLGNSFTPSGMAQTIDHTGTEIVTVTQGPFHSVGDRDVSLSPKRVPSMSFDDVVKKRLEQSRSITDLDVPPEIRWTGVGRQLSDHSLPGPRRHLDVGVSSPQQAPPAKPECPPPDSSSSESDDDIKQDKGKADVTLTHKHSNILSASGVSLASSRALDKFDSPPSSTSELLRALSEDTNKRKGLSALKAMSTERKTWDTVDGNLDKGASPTFHDHSLQGDTSFNYCRSEEDVKPLAKQPLPQLRLSSTPVDERRATDLLYNIPRYRRHDMGDTEPPQKAPPPVPATPPPPYEAVGLSRRSPQSSKTQGLESTRSYLQQSRKTEESTSSSPMSQNLAVYFDSSNVNISEV